MRAHARLNFWTAIVSAVIFMLPVSCSRQHDEQSTGSSPPVAGSSGAANIQFSMKPDVFKGDLISMFGENGTGPGKFDEPLGIALDSKGMIYIADSGNSRIQKFTSEGKLVKTFGDKGKGPEVLKTPNDLAIDHSDRIFVLDTGSNQVKVYTADGDYLYSFRETFAFPRGITISGDAVYVADTGNACIRKFGLDGTSITKWGRHGNDPGEFKGPVGIDADDRGNIYVVDTKNVRVQKFDSEGGFLASWKQENPLRNYLFYFIKADNKGLVYLTDALHNKIQIFTDEGKFLGYWERALDDREALTTPVGIDIDRKGLIYLTSRKYGVQVFRLNKSVRKSPHDLIDPSRDTDIPKKILLLGVDGIEWHVLMPLIRQNKTPNFKKLVEGGTYGYLNTLSPTSSPAIWTTIATGKNPDKHGITGWVVPSRKEGKEVLLRLETSQPRNLTLGFDVKPVEECAEQKMSVFVEDRLAGTVSLKPGWQTVKIALPTELKSTGTLIVRLQFSCIALPENEKKLFRDDWVRAVDRDYDRVFVDWNRARWVTAAFRRIWLENTGTGKTLVDISFDKPAGLKNVLLSGWHPPNAKENYRLAGKSRSVPVTSNIRKTSAIWNILSNSRKKVGVVGYFVSWPAEKVNGVIVSLKATFRLPDNNTGFAEIEDLTYPPEYLEEIRHRIHRRPIEHLYPLFMDVAPLRKIPRDTDLLVSIYNQDIINTEIGLDILANYSPDFFSIYLEGLDIVQHKYWRFHHKKQFDKKDILNFFNEPVSIDRLSGVIDEAYMQCDNLIGKFLEQADDDTTVVLVSDHGFVFTSLEHWHAPPGVFILYGKNILPAGELRYPTVYDITPTILYLSGLPIGRDMDGKPIMDAIDPRFRDRYPVTYIDTHDHGAVESDDPVETILDKELIERYRSLGYLQ